MQNIAVDTTFTQMTAKKGINRHVNREIIYIYKEYTEL